MCLYILLYTYLYNLLKMRCQKCSKDFSNSKEFFKHFRIVHKNCISYTCPVSDCSRNFSTINSLRKHFIHCRETSSNISISETTTDEANSKDEISISTCSQITIQQNIEQLVNFNLHAELCHDYNLIHISNISEVEKFALQIIGQLIIINKIPFKYIFLIMRQLSKITVFNAQLITNTILQLTNSSENMDLTNKIQVLSDNYYDGLKNFFSEYKFTKFLKSIDLYTDPLNLIVGCNNKVMKRFKRKIWTKHNFFISYVPLKMVLKQLLCIP